MAMEILGLLDTLESMIVEGGKIPFTKKVMVNEEKVLSLIDKLRLVIQDGGNLAKKAIDKDFEENGTPFTPSSGEERLEGVEGAVGSMSDTKAIEVIQQAYQMSKEVRAGADKYADEVLSNLESTSVRVLRTVQAGRERLKKSIGSGLETTSLPDAEKDLIGANS